MEEVELSILEERCVDMDIFIFTFLLFYNWCTAERVTHQRVFQQNHVFAVAQMSAEVVGKLFFTYLLTYLRTHTHTHAHTDTHTLTQYIHAQHTYNILDLE